MRAAQHLVLITLDVNLHHVRHEAERLDFAVHGRHLDVRSRAGGIGHVHHHGAVGKERPARPPVNRSERRLPHRQPAVDAVERRQRGRRSKPAGRRLVRHRAPVIARRAEHQREDPSIGADVEQRLRAAGDVDEARHLLHGRTVIGEMRSDRLPVLFREAQPDAAIDDDGGAGRVGRKRDGQRHTRLAISVQQAAEPLFQRLWNNPGRQRFDRRRGKKWDRTSYATSDTASARSAATEWRT